jgi:hypothetical protein
VARQRAEGDHIGLPASTASLVFFSESLANCVRLGLSMLAMRKVGWPPVLLGTYLCAGSCVTSGGLPDLGLQSVPTATQPTLMAEKFGGLTWR